MRQLSVDLLVDSGYEVEAVKDGAAGLDALQANDYDLVILATIFLSSMFSRSGSFSRRASLTSSCPNCFFYR